MNFFKLVSCVMALMAVCNGYSAEKRKIFSAEGLALAEDLKVEFGEGIGGTRDDALKEAMSDVLQRVVGVYVDSDFRVENDKIIKDQILTHCNGFIEPWADMESRQ